MQGNRCRRSWINQRCVNHSPFLVRPEIDGCASFTFHFLNGEVQRRAGNFAHSVLLISRWSAVPIFYLRTQLGIRREDRPCLSQVGLLGSRCPVVAEQAGGPEISRPMGKAPWQRQSLHRLSAYIG